MREAHVIPIINQLLREGANVTVYDPVAIPTAKTIFKNKIQYATSAISCLKNADCCIPVTEWDEFKKLKPEDFTKNIQQPIHRRKKNLQPTRIQPKNEVHRHRTRTLEYLLLS